MGSFHVVKYFGYFLKCSIWTGSLKAKKPISFNQHKTITIPSIFTEFFFFFTKVITLGKQQSAASILEFSTNFSAKEIYCAPVVFSVKVRGTSLRQKRFF